MGGGHSAGQVGWRRMEERGGGEWVEAVQKARPGRRPASDFWWRLRR